MNNASPDETSRHPVTLPACGILLGTGVYNTSKDYLLSTMPGHYTWQSQDFMPDEMIDRILADNQGNLAQVWGIPRGLAPRQLAEWKYALSEIGLTLPAPDWKTGQYVYPEDCAELKAHEDRAGAGFLRFLEKAAARGIYTQFIYADKECRDEWVNRMPAAGSFYVGYDFGERFCFRIDDRLLQGRSLADITLADLADRLVADVREHVDSLKAKGWKNIAATCGNFHLDYEILGGAEVPMFEDSGCSMHFTSALSRGLSRQRSRPLWGSHIAHEHYSWLPYANPHRMDVLRANLYLKYMAGAKILICESGNWFVEASLCPDSPKFALPQRTDLFESGKGWSHIRDFYRLNPKAYVEGLEEARTYYPRLNYDSPVCQGYRRVVSEFYDFVKANGTPAGQPEVTVALAKGNLDLANPEYSPNNAVAGAYALADLDSRWLEGAPERGWETVKKVFFPRPPVTAPNLNRSLSGTPYGMVDIVSFADDTLTAASLATYKALLFSGWNTCSDRQYALLRTYVEAGGRLCIALPHFSTNTTRNYASFEVDELVNRGDFSDLCGVRVKGRGKRFYWATPAPGSSALGLQFPRRFGTMLAGLGDLEIVDPAVEVLVIEDEQSRPVILRRACGKGEVYFINTWCYPGALDQDFGPGSTLDSTGLIGHLYAHLARQARGSVWITDDGIGPGDSCDHISCSYFPDSGTICLFNTDFEKARTCRLHAFGSVEPVTLEPGAFQSRRRS